MSRTTLYEPPSGWRERIKNLSENGLDSRTARLLLEVELCFRLVEKLGLADSETVGVVPALLSGVPLHGVEWTELQRRAIANVRQIAPFASASSWRNALETYATIPDEWRHYQFPNQPVPEIDDEADETPTARISRTEWLVSLLPKPENAQKHPQHTDLYDRALTESLPYHERSGGERAKPGETYRFTATNKNDEKQSYFVTFPQKLPVVGAGKWFDPATPRPRTPVTVHLRDDLEPVARFLDEADAKTSRPTKDWQGRLKKIRYHRVKDDGKVDEEYPDILVLKGFHHAAGMVASGKSTLTFLIAAWIALVRRDLRITAVVGSVQGALQFADELNTYFCTDIEADAPVAVPLLGRRTRDKHLRDLHGSRAYQERRAQGKGHWGERFLSVVCPLQSLVPDLAETPLPSGQEPCTNLRPLPSKKRKGAGSDDPEMPSEKRFLCPLYAGCPVQQMYHDMVGARVWITHPWAMAYAGLPRQVESRPIHIGEIVYEQSDIVVFDEADAVMGVFDEVFAEVAELTNGKDGIYDRLGTQTEKFTIHRRSDAGAHRMRWSHAQRSGQDASMILLALLNEPETVYLLQWLARTQFTPHSLMLRLARMICGLPEFSRGGDEDAPEEAGRVADAFEPFRLLFEIGGDPLRQKHLSSTDKDAAKRQAYQLWRILVELTAGSVNVFGHDLIRSCKTWLTETYPDIQTHLDTLNARRKTTTKKPETETTFENLERLAFRLIFVLAAALLDRNTDIVLYEWHSRAAPDEDDVEPHRRMPAVLRDILPLPPMGRQFGTYYAPGDSTKRNTNRLSYLSYTNIGRWYLLHFHRLRTDLDGKPGPHVLALSGTSYLPDSVRLHVGTGSSKPQGILKSEKAACEAIGKSEFRLLPLPSRTRTALRVSGTPEWEKPSVLRAVAQSLTGGADGGKLGAELTLLRQSSRENPAEWADRARLLLLVNSYDQAKTVGDALRQTWQSHAGKIYHLARPSNTREGDDVVGSVSDTSAGNAETHLLRTDIETFAQTGGQILVAPTSAIGRGFNILNGETKPLAAFGAVYFLVRPYPHPDDMTALAREINRRTLDWAEWAEFSPWTAPTIEGKFRAVRAVANEYWHDMEQRKYWRTLKNRPAVLGAPRRDLAAYTAGILVQAVGRLLRGGVPFHAFFCDAAYAPNTAKWYCAGGEGDTPEEADSPVNSLLAAVIDLLREMMPDDVARSLYEPLVNALCDFRVGIAPNDYPFEPDTHWQPPATTRRKTHE